MTYFTGDFMDFILDSDCIMFWATDDTCVTGPQYYGDIH